MNSSHVMLNANGWRPDVPDHRDLYFVRKVPALKASVPALDLDFPIDDQGFIGSCTGHAVTSMIEINVRRHHDGEAGKIPLDTLSRLMAYYLGRKALGTVALDSGAQIRDVIKGCLKQGVCTEPLWPYDTRLAFQYPNTKQLHQGMLVSDEISALKLKYYRVNSVFDLKVALLAGYSVAFGFVVPETIYDLTKTKHTLALPRKKDKVVGGHAVVAVGYTKSSVIVRNSWGKDWGNGGRFNMPFDWFSDERRLVDDMWVLK